MQCIYYYYYYFRIQFINPQDIDTSGTQHEVEVNREVILSAGVFSSPKILMLSGIGDKAQLAEFKIPVVVDSPGVGLNVQDHMYPISSTPPYSFIIRRSVPLFTTWPSNFPKDDKGNHIQFIIFGSIDGFSLIVLVGVCLLIFLSSGSIGKHLPDYQMGSLFSGGYSFVFPLSD